MLGALIRFLARCTRAMVPCIPQHSVTSRTNLSSHQLEAVEPDAISTPSLRRHTRLSNITLASGDSEVTIVSPHDSPGSSTDLGERATAMIYRVAQGADIVSELSVFRADEARCVLDAFQTWVDQHQESPHYRTGIYLMMELSAASGELPSSLYLHGVTVGNEPVAYGGFADIYRGTYNSQDVAVKRLRFVPANLDRMYKLFSREVLLWRQLRHPHVLPFLGIDAHSSRRSGHFCLVSPWLAGGTLMQQIEARNYSIDCRRLLGEVAQGLAYIHSQKVVHGDIHGGNVLIMTSGSACLADFGIANIGDVTIGRPMITAHSAGTIRWMAPERFTQPEAELQKEVDTWAFGCLCLLVYAFLLPFHDIDNEMMIMFKVVSGEKPKRPGGSEHRGSRIPDELWEVMTDCWSYEPKNRPLMDTVLTRLQSTVFDIPQEILDPLPESSSPLSQFSV